MNQIFRWSHLCGSSLHVCAMWATNKIKVNPSASMPFQSMISHDQSISMPFQSMISHDRSTSMPSQSIKPQEDNTMLYNIRIVPNGPKSKLDAAVLQLGRILGDTVLSTGKILREEPKLKIHYSKGPIPMEICHHIRKQQLKSIRRKYPCTKSILNSDKIVILTTGKSDTLLWNVNLFKQHMDKKNSENIFQPFILTPSSASFDVLHEINSIYGTGAAVIFDSMYLHDSGAPIDPHIVVIPNKQLDPVNTDLNDQTTIAGSIAVNWLLHHISNTVTIEAGPTITQPMYRRDDQSAPNYLLLSCYHGATLIPEAKGQSFLSMNELLSQYEIVYKSANHIFDSLSQEFQLGDDAKQLFQELICSSPDWTVTLLRHKGQKD